MESSVVQHGHSRIVPPVPPSEDSTIVCRAKNDNAAGRSPQRKSSKRRRLVEVADDSPIEVILLDDSDDDELATVDQSLKSPRRKPRGKPTKDLPTSANKQNEVLDELATVGRALRSPRRAADKSIGKELNTASARSRSLRSPQRRPSQGRPTTEINAADRPENEVATISAAVDGSLRSPQRQSRRKQSAERMIESSAGDAPVFSTKQLADATTDQETGKAASSPGKDTRRRPRQSVSPQMRPDTRTSQSGVANNPGLPPPTEDESAPVLQPSGNIKKRKNTHRIPPDVLEDDIDDDEDDVFAPEVRRFRTPGRKSGNFPRPDDSKQLRTPRSRSAAKSAEQPGPSQDTTGKVPSSVRRSSRTQEARHNDDVVLLEGAQSNQQKRKSKDVVENEPKLRQREELAEVVLLPMPSEKSDSPESLADFKTAKQANSMSATSPTTSNRLITNTKGKKSRASMMAKQKRLKRKQAIVNRLKERRLTRNNNKNGEAVRTGTGGESNDHDDCSDVAKDIDNVIASSCLLVEDIDKVINAAKETTSPKRPSANQAPKVASPHLPMPPGSNKRRSTTPVPPHIAALMEPEPRSEPNLLSLFRSESSAWDASFAGFPSDDIRATGQNLLHLSAADLGAAGMEERLEQAALTVCCIPTSELDIDQTSVSSHSSSSVDIGDISMVFKSMENFPSDPGSDWEVNINECFENAVEDLKRRTSELQALTPKSHDDRAVVAGEGSLKENLAMRKDATTKTAQKQTGEGNTADGFAEMPSTAAWSSRSTRRSARNKNSNSQDTMLTISVPYTNSSGKSPAHASSSGTFKAPLPSPQKIVTSTPIRGRLPEVDNAIPCISFPLDTPKEDQIVVLDNYVHDVDGEVDFPKFSSPDRGALGISPVKFVMLNNGEIGSPRPPRQSNLKMSKDGFTYQVSPSSAKPPVTMPDARKSLFNMSLDVNMISSGGSHQQLSSPTSTLNRSNSATPLSAASTLNRSIPNFNFYNYGKNGSRTRKRSGSLSNVNKKSNFSSEILKPDKRKNGRGQHLQTKRLSRKNKNKPKMPRRSVSLTDALVDRDIYDFVDDGLGKSQGRRSPPCPAGSPSKKNFVSVSIQTNPEDLEPRSEDLSIRVPKSPVKSPQKRRRERPAQTLSLACFNPVVNLTAADVLPREYWH